MAAGKRPRVERSGPYLNVIVPTILDLMHVDAPTGDKFDFVSGQSLVLDVVKPPSHEPKERVIFVDMSADLVGVVESGEHRAKRAELRVDITVDLQPRKRFARVSPHFAPVDESELAGLAPERDVFRDRQRRDQIHLLINRADAGRLGVRETARGDQQSGDEGACAHERLRSAFNPRRHRGIHSIVPALPGSENAAAGFNALDDCGENRG